MEVVAIIVGIGLLIGLLIWIINSFSKNKNSNAVQSVSNGGTVQRESSEMLYYVCFDNEVYGGFTLSELKNDYPILEDTLITTDTLNGEWYEAKCFECFDDLFNSSVQSSFRINEFGEIVRG